MFVFECVCVCGWVIHNQVHCNNGSENWYTGNGNPILQDVHHEAIFYILHFKEGLTQGLVGLRIYFVCTARVAIGYRK